MDIANALKNHQLLRLRCSDITGGFWLFLYKDGEVSSVAKSKSSYGSGRQQ